MVKVRSEFQKNIEIGITDCNALLNIKASSIQKYLVDTSMNHCNKMRIGYYDLEKLGFMWVICELEIHINAIPTFGEIVKLRTWPIKPRLIIAERNYEMYNRIGEIQGYALSSWCILDKENRKPVKISTIKCNEPKYIDSKYKKSKFQFCKKENLELMGEDVVKVSDLDVNKHMNNTRYISKVLDLLSATQYENFNPTVLHMKFVKEVGLNTKLSIYKYFDGNKWYFEMRIKDTDEVSYQLLVKF